MSTSSPTAELPRLAGVVIDLHPKSNESWSRFKLEKADGTTAWVTAKFGVELREIVIADCTYNDKFRSYDVVRLVDDGKGTVSNEVVVLKLIDTLDGVGKIKARRLAEKFPELFAALTEKPDEVAAACGIQPDKVREVAQSLTNERGQLSRISELVNKGFPQHLAKRIAYDDNQYRVAVKNPYAAIKLVSGLGWLIADEVGRKQGIKTDDPERIKAGIDHHYREKVIGDGHTVVRGEELLARENLPSLLGVAPAVITPFLEVVLVPLGGGWYTTAFQRKNAEIIATTFTGAA